MLGIRKVLTVFWVAGVVVMWPLRAPADWMDLPNDTVWGSGMSYLPPADLTGWFFHPDAFPPFPAAPDSSQPWTSAANIATLNYWLGLVTDLGDNPAALDQLSAAEVIGATGASPLDFSQAQADPGAPEPAAAALLGGGLLAICLMALVRARRIRDDTLIENVPI